MSYRGIRGATTVDNNTPHAIISATRELLEKLIAANDVQIDDIASVIFTATPDLNAAYPAVAAREMGWATVPLLCMQEMQVVDSLSYCIRTLVHCNTERSAQDIHHVYLREARTLRPDLAQH